MVRSQVGQRNTEAFLSDEIGSRAWLLTRCPKGRVGSSPTSGARGVAGLPPAARPTIRHLRELGEWISSGLQPRSYQFDSGTRVMLSKLKCGCVYEFEQHPRIAKDLRLVAAYLCDKHKKHYAKW